MYLRFRFIELLRRQRLGSLGCPAQQRSGFYLLEFFFWVMCGWSGSVGLGQSSVHTPSSSSSGSSTNSSRTDGSRPQRVQMVLGELYHVQSLMDTFSARIDTCVARNHKSLTWSPFSVAVLNSLDTELRKRLSTLSLELIDRLKQHWG